MSHPTNRKERRNFNFKHRGSDCTDALHTTVHGNRHLEQGAGRDLEWDSPRWRWMQRSEARVHVKIGDAFAHLAGLNEYYYQNEFETDFGNAEPIEFCEYCRKLHEPGEYWNKQGVNFSQEEFDDDPGGYSDWFHYFSTCPKAEAEWTGLIYDAVYEQHEGNCDVLFEYWIEPEDEPLTFRMQEGFFHWFDEFFMLGNSVD